MRVTGEAEPPESDTRSKPVLEAPKRMTPLAFQAPSRNPPVYSHKICGGPPDSATFFKRPGEPFTPNARNRLSGDQIGPAMAPSVPAKGRASSVSSGRTHKTGRPSTPGASNAMRRPSGDKTPVVPKVELR